jgi:hypothetical protein
VKTTGIGGQRGDDGAKKSKGRKRHLLVKTQGWVLTVKVHPADVRDRDGVMLWLPPEPTKAQFPRRSHVGLDAGSKRTAKGQDGMEQTLGWATQTVRPPPRRVLVFEAMEPPPHGRPSRCGHGGGWWKVATYNTPSQTPTVYPIMGLTGLLNLVTVVDKFRPQAVEEKGSVGQPPSSPPVHRSQRAQPAVGTAAYDDSPTPPVAAQPAPGAPAARRSRAGGGPR